MADEHRPSRLVWFVGLLLLVGSTAGTAWYLNVIPGPGGNGSGTNPSPAAPSDIVAPGRVDARSRVVPLFPAQPGRVVKVEVKEGGEVAQAGVSLIVLDDRPARLRRDEAKVVLELAEVQRDAARRLGEQHAAKVKQQKTAIRVAEQGVRTAEAMHKHTKESYELKLAKDADLAGAEAKLESARALLDAEHAKLEELAAHAQDAPLGLRRAEAEVEAARVRLSQAELALEECTLRSPGPGKVLRLQAGEGEMLGPQSLQAPVMFWPFDSDESRDLIVRAEVNQEDIGRVRKGKPAVVWDEAGAESRRWEGEVAHVPDFLAPRRATFVEPGEITSTTSLECIIKITSREPPLYIGQRVRVHIQP